MTVQRRRLILNSNRLSAYAINFKANVAANGYAIPADLLADMDKYIFKPLNASGDLANLDRLHVFAAMGNRLAAQVNLISSAYKAIEVSSPSYSNASGYTGDGVAAYMHYNYNPGAGGTLLTLNSATIGYGTKYANIPQTQSYGARKLSATACVLAIFRLSSSNVDVVMNDNTDLNNPNVVYNQIVMHAGQRTAASGANCKASIINSNFVYANHASVAIPNLAMYNLCRNQDNTANSFDDKPHYYDFAGNGLVNTTNIMSAMNNFFTARGVS